jgi:RimJ/RimL family protein N-acetyltransferase
LNLIASHEATIIDWLARVHSVHVLQTPRLVLGIIDRDGVLRGAFVITWRNDVSAELHVYGALSNGVVGDMFRTVFEGCNLHRLEVRTSRRHKKVRKAAIKFGFRFEGLAREYYGPGEDAFVYGMTSSQCRWLKRMDHGQPILIA